MYICSCLCMLRCIHGQTGSTNGWKHRRAQAHSLHAERANALQQVELHNLFDGPKLGPWEQGYSTIPTHNTIRNRTVPALAEVLQEIAKKHKLQHMQSEMITALTVKSTLSRELEYENKNIASLR